MAEPGDNYHIEIEYEELQGILDSLASAQREVAEANGELRSRIKATIDGKGFQKTALAMIRQIDAMSTSKRNDFLRTFEPLFDVMLAGKWSDAQHELDLEEEDQAA